MTHYDSDNIAIVQKVNVIMFFLLNRLYDYVLFLKKFYTFSPPPPPPDIHASEDKSTHSGVIILSLYDNGDCTVTVSQNVKHKQCTSFTKILIYYVQCTYNIILSLYRSYETLGADSCKGVTSN